MPGPLSCAALAEMPELVFKITVGYLCDTWEPLENRIVLSFVSSGSLIKEGRWHVVFQSWNVKEAGILLFPSQKVHLFFSLETIWAITFYLEVHLVSFSVAGALRLISSLFLSLCENRRFPSDY